MKRTFRRAVRRPRKRAIWVNIPFGGVAFTESVGNQVLLVPEDWEASFTDSRWHLRWQLLLGHLHCWSQ